MEKNTKLLMVLVSAVLITSGCMEGGESEASTEAVSISDFSITPNPSPGGQQATLQMQVENAGDAVATDVRANLFGPTIGDGTRTWSALEGTKMEFNDLQPATDNQPAIPQQASLTMETPELEQGRDLPYDFNSQIFYGYETTASTSLQVMSQERYQETGASQEQTSVSNSNGPIQLSVQGTTPIVFQPDTGGERTSDLCITVTNSGSGLPFNPGALPTEDSSDIDDDDENNVELEIENVGNIVFTAEEDGEVETEDGVATSVDIIGNEGFHCFTMTAAGLGDITTLEQTANIEIDADYGYREETATSVTVEGRGTSSSGSSDTGSSSSDDSEDNEGPGAPPTPGE
ncbi:MAG: hypothetical protein R6V35_04185 [Candidatus Nanohaloarchaea archaeon]